MKRFAVVPTRDRPQAYAACIASIRGQIDVLVTVAHMGARYAMGEVVRYDEDPPNISRMWRLGIERCAESADDAFYVAILNDDARVPPDWFGRLQARMEEEGTVLGSGRAPGLGVRNRPLCGPAFILKGGTVLPNEAFTWWASDDWLAREAEEAWGGRTWIPDLRIGHLPNVGNTPSDPELLERAMDDRARWHVEKRSR